MAKSFFVSFSACFPDVILSPGSSFGDLPNEIPSGGSLDWESFGGLRELFVGDLEERFKVAAETPPFFPLPFFSLFQALFKAGGATGILSSFPLPLWHLLQEPFRVGGALQEAFDAS